MASENSSKKRVSNQAATPETSITSINAWCILSRASGFLCDLLQVPDDLFKREERTIRRRPTAPSVLLVNQQHDAVFPVLRTEVAS